MSHTRATDAGAITRAHKVRGEHGIAARGGSRIPDTPFHFLLEVASTPMDSRGSLGSGVLSWSEEARVATKRSRGIRIRATISGHL